MGPVTFMVLSPILGALALLFVPQQQINWVRRIAVLAAAVSLGLALYLVLSYDRALAGVQWVDTLPWIQRLGIQYQVGVDGISAVLGLLHALCGLTGVLISYRINERVKEYFIFYLLLIGGVFGVFAAQDLFFFYLFYEMAVIPMFPLIGIWGSKKDRDYATMKLTLYLTAGAVLALIGLLVLYFNSGLQTFDMIALKEHFAAQPLSANLQRFIFPFLLFGFGVIAPMWPFHSWSPMGHAAAPSAVSMLHAGVLMKLGSYAIIRVALSLLPVGAAAWLPWVAGLACMNIVYGGLVAMAQKDVKFIIGYSSSSHMGYVLLGIACLNSIALNGAVLLMFAHGIMTALAFAAVGHVYDQTHTRVIGEWGGLARQVPFIGVAFAAAALASSGLPGFANFISELLVFFGSWDTYRWASIAAIFGIVVTAFYMLRAVRTGFFGPLNLKWTKLQDATNFEKIPYLILGGVLLAVGCWPKPLLELISSSTGPILAQFELISQAALR